MCVKLVIYQEALHFVSVNLIPEPPQGHVRLNKEYTGLTSNFIRYVRSRTNAFFSLFSASFRPSLNPFTPFQRTSFFSYLPCHTFQRSPHAFNFQYFPIGHKMFILILCSKFQFLIFRRPNEYTCYLYPSFDTTQDIVLKSRPTQV